MTATLAPIREVELGPLARLESLCDPGTVQLIRTTVISGAVGETARSGDGVIAGSGLVDGQPVFCYAQDQGFLGGSLGQAHADTIVRVYELAERSGTPVVSFIASAGARMQEGVAALGGYGRVFRKIVSATGRTPQISIISGLSAGGGAYAPALTDWVVMTRDACMFLTGPGVVREALGEDVTAAELGGPSVQARNGVCHFVAADEPAAAGLARTLLGYLRPNPSRVRHLDREGWSGDPERHVPHESRRVYDIRDVVREIADGADFLEAAAGWARNLVTGLCRIDGQTVGIVANQPRYLAGVIDAEASQKGAWFVGQCDRQGIPLLVLVDTPGFMPGSRQESAGVIRFGATLVRAFAQATVPKITVILRKAFGGAFITMNSKDLGADYVFAWPRAQIGVMAARSAVGIIRRRDIAAADDPDLARERLSAEYARTQLAAGVAASGGHIDELIEPRDTRRRVARALHSLGGASFAPREEMVHRG